MDIMDIRFLDSVYDQALKGLPLSGFDSSVDDLAQEYMRGTGTLAEKIDNCITWQIAKCSASGFVTGLPGGAVGPLLAGTIAADLACVWYVQLRMIAVIAKMCDYDVHDDRVRTLAYVCLCGQSAMDILKKAGIKVGEKITKKMITKYYTRAVKKMLFDTISKKSLKKIGPPFVGGILSGALNGIETKTIGNVAKQIFITNVA